MELWKKFIKFLPSSIVLAPENSSNDTKRIELTTAMYSLAIVFTTKLHFVYSRGVEDMQKSVDTMLKTKLVAPKDKRLAETWYNCASFLVAGAGKASKRRKKGKLKTSLGEFASKTKMDKTRAIAERSLPTGKTESSELYGGLTYYTE